MTYHWFNKKNAQKMKLLIPIGMGILLGLWVTLVYAGDTVSHSVRINVVHKNAMAFGNEDSMSFKAPSLSFQKIEGGDGCLDRLHWVSSPTDKKISVSVKKSPVPNNIHLSSQEIQKDSQNGRLSMVDTNQNIVTSAPGKQGSCELKYSYDSDAHKVNHQDCNTVMFTMMDD
jgi:hypothetical protein